MSSWLLFILIAAAVGGGGLVFRWSGRRTSRNNPRFRDMPAGVAIGYVAGAAAIIGVVGAYAASIEAVYFSGDLAKANKFYFFRLAVHFLILCTIGAIVFRAIGRRVGTAGTRKLFRSMPLTASFGVLVILLYALVAIFAPLIAPFGESEILASANIPAGTDPTYPLGTDQIGRDILSRLIYGAKNTVGIAFATTCLAFFIGSSLGLLAATLGGWLDQLLSRGVDALMAIPALIFSLLLMTIANVWANRLGIPLTIFMIVIIAVIDATRVFRLARAVGSSIVVMDYIEAAKLRGEGLGYLIFRELLPNAYAPLLAEFGLRFCFVFLTIASLSFLGVGIQPPLADWGTMVRDMGQFINYAQFAPRAALVPLLAAGAIALLTVAVNFVVDWMLHKTSGLKE